MNNKNIQENIILSDKCYDDAEVYEFRLLYVLNQPGYLYITNIESQKTTETKLHGLKNITPTDLANIKEDDDNYGFIKMIDVLIEKVLSINGTAIRDSLEAKEIRKELTQAISNLSKEEYTTIRLNILEKEDNETILKQLNRSSEILINSELKEQEENIISNLKARKNINKTRQQLGDYLNKKGVILRKNTHHVYYLDKKSNGYSSVSNDDIIIALSNKFGKNVICDDDLSTSLTFIHERLIPTYNIIKLGNCLYSMDTHKNIKSEKPVFTLTETKYNYNPNAKNEYIEKFLYSSLARFNEDGTNDYDATEDAVIGFLQLVGYCFVSGNPRTLLAFLTGVSGGGKTLAGNLITEIFGTAKVSDAKLHDLSKGGFSTSQLVNSVVNIVRDVDDKIIEDNGLLKQISGYEDLAVEEKYKNPYPLPKEEVPTMLTVCNNMPAFKKIEKAIIERIGIIEFHVKFRGTEKEDKHLEKKIIESKEDIEWLIYNSLEAYKNMCLNDTDFNFRVDETTTLELLNKHSNPLSYLIRKLIMKHDPEAYNHELNMMQNKDVYIPTNELNKLAVYLAKKEGIELPLNNNSKISPRKLINAIKKEFDLYDWTDDNGRNYNTTTTQINGKNERIYPYLIKTPLYNKLLKEIKTLYTK